jgi:hypothetical protein
MQRNKITLKQLEVKLVNKALNSGNVEFLITWCTPSALELSILRKKAGLTQKELAQRVGTKQESISRLESHPEEVTLSFVGRVAYGLGYKAELRFEKLK